MRTFEAQGQVRDMSPLLLAIVHTAGVFPVMTVRTGQGQRISMDLTCADGCSPLALQVAGIRTTQLRALPTHAGKLPRPLLRPRRSRRRL